MTKEKIQLGDKVKCIYTGVEGIATSKTEYINGCIQIVVASKWDKKTGEVPETAIDQESLKIISKAQRKVKKDSSEEEEEEVNGGPMRKGIKQRGY